MMASKKERWLNNNWVVTILGCSLATVLGTLAYDKVKDKPILTTIIIWLNWVWKIILSIFTFKVAIWAIVLVTISLYCLRRTHLNFSKKTPPDHAKYTQDRFYNWIWKWDWKYDGVQQTWYVANLQPYCQTCNTQLVNKTNFVDVQYECPRCKSFYSLRGLYNAGPPEDIQNVEALIIDNVRKRHY